MPSEGGWASYTGHRYKVKTLQRMVANHLCPFHRSHLVDRVENLRRNAIGNGSSQCVLCGDEFGILGASPTFCEDCAKVCDTLSVTFLLLESNLCLCSETVLYDNGAVGIGNRWIKLD